MAVNWTKEQKKAIETSGCNLLVAAAAGSGKTAVLVERIVNLVADGEIEVDELLVTDLYGGRSKEDEAGDCRRDEKTVGTAAG